MNGADFNRMAEGVAKALAWAAVALLGLGGLMGAVLTWWLW